MTFAYVENLTALRKMLLELINEFIMAHGWLSRLSVCLLISAQAMIPESWDGALCQARTEHGDCLRFSLSLSLSLSFSLSLPLSPAHIFSLILNISIHINLSRLEDTESLHKNHLYFYILAIKNQKLKFQGIWVAQLVKHWAQVQVMISPLVILSPTSGSVLIAWSLEPASDSVYLSLRPSPTHALSLSRVSIKKI